jgi:mannobiose 2-epimerase
MNRTAFQTRLKQLQRQHEQLIKRRNRPQKTGNGIFDRYEFPVLTAEHTPLSWRYDFNPASNPHLMTRLGINCVFNVGAMEWNGNIVLMARVEGWDRKSFFAVAESKTGVDGFRFWDAQHGGAFWRLDDAGRVIDDSKKIYGQAFYIYALAEYHQAFGGKAALERAIQLFELIERHAHDPRHGGYIEVCRRDWSEAGAEARLSDKDMNEKKSMNNHLHILEAYTNLYRAWPEPRVAERLRELIQLFEQRILDARTQHFQHFFDETWRVRSDSYTFGHDIEGTWLLCEAAEVLGDAALLKQVQGVVLPMVEVVLKEGIAADGALYYEGKGGKIIDPGKECWPQAEAVIGFLNAFQLSGDRKYLQTSLRAYDFIENRLVDRAHGEWFWRINEDGKLDPKLPKVSEWKGPYHGSRMCLETLHRLRAISG